MKEDLDFVAKESGSDILEEFDSAFSSEDDAGEKDENGNQSESNDTHGKKSDKIKSEKKKREASDEEMGKSLNRQNVIIYHFH